MYDIRIRVNLDQLEERDPMQAFNIDHALYEARKTIMNSFIDFKTRGAGGASDFQHAVEMAVNSVLDQASNDNDDDGDDLFDRKMMYGFLWRLLTSIWNLNVQLPHYHLSRVSRNKWGERGE